MLLAYLAALLAIASLADAQVPTWPVTWALNRSTYWYSCRQDAPNDPALATNWSIINIDWSNEKDIWAKEKPMRCEERLFEQAQAFKAARPAWARSWVYRNTCKALPWYSTVRTLLSDPAYAPWFLNFASNATVNGSYYSPPCDANYDPPLCSNYYHDSVCPAYESGACQVPGYPTGDGDCAAPACDVGPVPVGEYLWDPRAWNTSINGQTLGDWWKDTYLFGPLGAGNENITGFYARTKKCPPHARVAPLTDLFRAPYPSLSLQFDDGFGPGGCSEMEQHQTIDLGLSAAELQAVADAYTSNMREVYSVVLERGAFAEQLFFHVPFINDNSTCAPTMRSLCSAASEAQTRFALFDLNTWPGNGDVNTNVSIAEFLLGRGPYAVTGITWSGCGCGCGVPDWVPLFDADFGTPIDAVCAETSPGVFSRRWSNADISLDCNSPGQATPHIDLH